MDLLRKANTRAIGLTIVCLMILSAIQISPSALVIKTEFTNDILSIVGSLVLISLFLERAIEIFLSTWRSEEADNLDEAIRQKTKEIDDARKIDPNSADLKALEKTLANKQRDRIRYSAKSRIYAQWAGLIMGLFIALVGIRILDHIVALNGDNDIQQQLFMIVDILLTASVLAGGSDAINKIMKVYNGFMNNSINKSNPAR